MSELEAASKEDDMSATSSLEVTIAPVRGRAGIKVWLHLHDIFSRRSHTTEEGVELDIEETNFSHKLRLVSRRDLYVLACRRLKVIKFSSIGCHLKFLRTRYRARILSRHPLVKTWKGKRWWWWCHG